jgi:hypothetical protein
LDCRVPATPTEGSTEVLGTRFLRAGVAQAGVAARGRQLVLQVPQLLAPAARQPLARAHLVHLVEPAADDRRPVEPAMVAPT